MKLEKRIITDIVDKCATRIIANIGETQIAHVPYDVISAEISEIVEEIEDGIDKSIQATIDSVAETHTIEDLWD
jgi:hypothetical protein